MRAHEDYQSQHPIDVPYRIISEGDLKAAQKLSAVTLGARAQSGVGENDGVKTSPGEP